MKLSARQWLIHGSLFVVTFLTATVAGSLYADVKTDDIITYLMGGWVFSVPLMAILLTHEMGHYLFGTKPSPVEEKTNLSGKPDSLETKKETKETEPK